MVIIKMKNRRLQVKKGFLYITYGFLKLFLAGRVV